MIQSILVYTSTALCLYAFGKNASNREEYLKRTSNRELNFFCFEIVLSLILFAVISGVRYKVGMDHLSYLGEYQRLMTYGETRRDTMEGGFLLISKLFAYNGVHFSIYFGFWALLQFFFLYYAFRHNKKLLPYLGLVIMLGPFYLSMMNGMRQQTVAFAFIFLIEWIEKRKFWPFVFAILLSSTIHKSAVILLPIYFLLNSKIDFTNRKICFIILAVSTFLGETPTWLKLINSIEGLLSILGYDAYSDNIELMTTENLRTMAWGPGRISIFVASCFIIYHYNNLKEFFKDDKKIRMYFILFFIGTCAYNMFANTSHIFLRPVEYFTLFRLPLSAYLMYYFFKKIKAIQFYLFLLLTCCNIYVTVIKATMTPEVKSSGCILYKFFWEYDTNQLL